MRMPQWHAIMAASLWDVRFRTRARASACGIARSAPSPDLNHEGQKIGPVEKSKGVDSVFV